MTDKGTRWVGLAALVLSLSACGLQLGGELFVPSEAGGPADAGRDTSITGSDDGGGEDSGSPYLDASDTSSPASDAAADTGSVDATDASPAPDATDASDSSTEDAEPACVTKPPIAWECTAAPLPATAPLQTCIQTQTTVLAVTTPAACASWCTYTCACLADAGICGATGGPFMCGLVEDGLQTVGCPNYQ